MRYRPWVDRVVQWDYILEIDVHVRVPMPESRIYCDVAFGQITEKAYKQEIQISREIRNQLT